MYTCIHTQLLVCTYYDLYRHKKYENELRGTMRATNNCVNSYNKQHQTETTVYSLITLFLSSIIF